MFRMLHGAFCRSWQMHSYPYLTFAKPWQHILPTFRGFRTSSALLIKSFSSLRNTSMPSLLCNLLRPHTLANSMHRVYVKGAIFHSLWKFEHIFFQTVFHISGPIESPAPSDCPTPSPPRHLCCIWKPETCRHLPEAEQHILVHRVSILI